MNESKKNILVVGSGGREHAIVKSLGEAASTNKVFAHPGSDAIFESALKFNLEKSASFDQIYEQIMEHNISLVVIGPEVPLVEGLSDFLRGKNILVFGPCKNGAKLEGDKVFSKIFMDESKVPTGEYILISDTDSLEKGMEAFSHHPFYVFKYKDLAGGKGVLVSKDKNEVRAFAKKFEVHDNQKNTVGYLDEPLIGWELSLICLVNETGYEVCPILQDHKRLLDGDEGPNTGGMGVAGPVVISESLEKDLHEKIIKPTLEGFRKRKMTYRGVIYIGVMVTEKGPKVLEYNVRFGDPEAQLIFPMVESDWANTLTKISSGDSFDLTLKKTFGCCVVMAAEGYPESPVKDVEIFGLDEIDDKNVFHAGTKKSDKKWLVNGGRVLNLFSLGSSLEESRRLAYESVSKISWTKEQHRMDIGSKI